MKGGLYGDRRGVRNRECGNVHGIGSAAMCAPARKNWVLAHRVTLPWVWGREQCVEVELGALLIMDPKHTLVRLREAQTQFAAETSLFLGL